MQPGRRELLTRRRSLLWLAAIGAAGLSAACGGDEKPLVDRIDTPTPPASRTSETGGPVSTAPPAPPTPAGQPICLVTKDPSRGLLPGYTPGDLVTLPSRVVAKDGIRLRREAADALVALVDAARAGGQTLFVLDGFRPYQEQERVYKDEVARFGPAQAAKQVAPPGHSEHQLGLAADITSPAAPGELREQFGQEPEGRWLAANSPAYGYVVSYPAGKENVTGYVYEPWHIRYVGPQLAQSIATSGLTLTEFLPKYSLDGPCP